MGEDEVKMWEEGTGWVHPSDLITILTCDGRVVKQWYSQLEEVHAKADKIQFIMSSIMKDEFFNTGFRLHHINHGVHDVYTEALREVALDDETS